MGSSPELDVNRISLDCAVGIVMFCYPFIGKLNNFSNYIDKYNQAFKKETDNDSRLRFSLIQKVWHSDSRFINSKNISYGRK